MTYKSPAPWLAIGFAFLSLAAPQKPADIQEVASVSADRLPPIAGFGPERDLDTVIYDEPAGAAPGASSETDPEPAFSEEETQLETYFDAGEPVS